MIFCYYCNFCWISTQFSYSLVFSQPEENFYIVWLTVVDAIEVKHDAYGKQQKIPLILCVCFPNP